MITFIRNPRKGWRQVKGRRKHNIGDISDVTMLEYVTKLYNHHHAIEMGKLHVYTNLTFEDIEAGLKKMANGKALDHMQIHAGFVKWIGDSART